MSGQNERDAAGKEVPRQPSALDRAVMKVQPMLMPWVEKMMVPDTVLRFGIRKMLQATVNKISLEGDVERQSEQLAAFVADLKTREIAEQTSAANEQHYEVPAAFFKIMLGPYLKYSSGLWESEDSTLEESEVAMLKLFCERAGLPNLAEGSTVLDLGCGWGSLTLYAAQQFPKLQFTCVSNSNSQREFIQSRCDELKLTNVTPKTCDVNVLDLDAGSFDRVMSVEMFEHMKNYEKLLGNISRWLKPDGKLMVHIFVHDQFPYHFEKGWMAETFFAGGTMPSRDLFLNFAKDLRVERQWSINGNHYARTLEAWLNKMDEKENKATIIELFKKVYGEGNEIKHLQEWRLFNMACAEVFSFNQGNEWYVSHYLFTKNR
eukprot:CAMPEP_0202082988 /NCGR_PEP_ID=MMETSP0964-20121228/21888_1 /ASSEMBLY_ACC=CAM_ASM_000500 /TAXON_ID=4773 /ORGANISM="Schizochytrium aggregatum, Strain ATCC28209" /LENGTH=375 /DNA_ID=CAMNT_0048650669 /DNA_START=64 /DNA_END=1191 /DNA_ORIENTATION=-